MFKKNPKTFISIDYGNYFWGPLNYSHQCRQTVLVDD